jgi:hypothetical protein
MSIGPRCAAADSRRKGELPVVGMVSTPREGNRKSDPPDADPHQHPPEVGRREAMKLTRTVIVCACLGVLAISAAARAGAISDTATLDQVGHKPFVIGDKAFKITGFDVQGVSIDRSKVEVRPINHGLRGIGFEVKFWQGAFGFLAHEADPDSLSLDAASRIGDRITIRPVLPKVTLNYDVWVLPEWQDKGFRIVDVHLGLEAGREYRDVQPRLAGETVTLGGIDPIFGISVMEQYVGPSIEGSLTASINRENLKDGDADVFLDNPQVGLRVTKMIELDLDFPCIIGDCEPDSLLIGEAQASCGGECIRPHRYLAVRQTFSQIPEPASLALLGAGSILFVSRRRR